MVECSVCSERSVVNFSKPFCKVHFFEDVESRVLETIREERLVEPGDKVLVACSGGKDSVLLLRVLSKFFPGQVVALLVDEGIEGYRSDTVKFFLRFVKEWGVPFVIKSFREEFGSSMDENVKRVSVSPCYVCGVFRRSVINRVARELGCSKVATGHNLDDEVQTVLMNLFMGDVLRQARLGFSTGVVVHDKFVKRVKPLRRVLEKESLAYSLLMGWGLSFVECPYSRHAFRLFVAELLNEFESKHKGSKVGLLRNFDFLKRFIDVSVVGGVSLGECVACGEPCSGSLCKKCKLLEVLGG